MDIQTAFDETAGGATWHDFAWYAVDESDQLGVFTTAGFGPTPRSVFTSRDTYVALAAYVEQLPLAMGNTRVAADSRELRFWVDSASRGLHGYDWDTVAGQPVPLAPYRWKASPVAPLVLDSLPSLLADYLRLTRIHNVQFGVDLEIVVERHFPGFLDEQPN